MAAPAQTERDMLSRRDRCMVVCRRHLPAILEHPMVVQHILYDGIAGINLSMEIGPGTTHEEVQDGICTTYSLESEQGHHLDLVAFGREVALAADMCSCKIDTAVNKQRIVTIGWGTGDRLLYGGYPILLSEEA